MKRGKKILYVYRTRRKPILKNWREGRNPDSMLFGYNHLAKMGYQVEFFDTAYWLFNPWHWLFYPLEHLILREVGMGFKLDQAMTLLPKLSQYDVIVCTGDSCGLPFLFLKHLGLIKKPIIYLSSALTGALRANPKSWVINFYRRIFKSVDILTCYAQVEREYFIRQLRVPRKRVKYIPYGTDWNFFSKPSKRKRSIVATVGIDKTRDYKTFFEAIKDLKIPVEVACHPDNVKGLTVPKNVKVRFLIDYVSVRSMFQRAKVLVVPCREAGRSAGQMVALEAGSAKTPLVVSAIRGMTEAFELKDKRHLFYVQPEDSQIMKKKIKYLLDRPQVSATMGREISSFVKQNYTSKHLAQNVAKFINELS